MSCPVIPLRPKDDRVAVRLVETRFFTRWPCHVCGGHTEKVAILAEAEDGTRVCETCLQAGNIDDRLEARAAALEQEAASARALIGRLKIPTYAEWRAATVGNDREMMRELGMSEAEILAAEAERSRTS